MLRPAATQSTSPFQSLPLTGPSSCRASARRACLRSRRRRPRIGGWTCACRPPASRMQASGAGWGHAQGLRRRAEHKVRGPAVSCMSYLQRRCAQRRVVSFSQPHILASPISGSPCTTLPPAAERLCDDVDEDEEGATTECLVRACGVCLLRAHMWCSTALPAPAGMPAMSSSCVTTTLVCYHHLPRLALAYQRALSPLPLSRQLTKVPQLSALCRDQLKRVMVRHAPGCTGCLLAPPSSAFLLVNSDHTPRCPSGGPTLLHDSCHQQHVLMRIRALK